MEIYTLFHIQSNSFSISHVTRLTGTETEKQKKIMHSYVPDGIVRLDSQFRLKSGETFQLKSM